ncbi:MAG TPA: N-acetylglucosamine-6-phosphate deacetylase [Actinocrinis sp.]|uniref:N-acetylglucosamine-6-phosphate deacetylase n=1 Tax=Actinocrinis sp. TaxID=1920516 RepID=UPI002DDD0C00|nr:N-acetylglucosamine-6-phosphate deacetylase [Actinocrinis sp.]HEV2343815.1 N-acetylglucosamine-6-phosphate deacetylase [Actinocrinis sp.]
MPTISAPRAVVDGRLTGPVTIAVQDGVIREVRHHHDAPRSAPADVALPDGILTAGLVDIQINGAFGVDFCAADDDGWDRVASALTGTGVTSFQPTYITAPLGALVSGLQTAIEARQRQADTGSARILGVHLEGPFLSPVRHGVHEKRYLAEPTAEAIDRLLNAPGREILTMVTLAPELPGAIDAVHRLTAAGIRVSVGHTDALAAQITAAADAGATLVTHIFNAQRGLAHREPGVPGATMADRRFYCGLIADLHHVAPEICGLIWKGARGRVVLVTDAIAAAGMPPGEYELSGIPVVLSEDGVPRNADGTIAGSALTLDQAVRNMISLGLPVAQVVEAASRVPADALGRHDVGRIAVGARADLVWWSDDFHPRRTWVDGREAQAPATATAVLPAARESFAVSP